jgi:competence ComEA-like helix-hairpin-helix protein
MQRKSLKLKLNYFNIYFQSAKQYSAIIILYCLIFSGGCRQNAVRAPLLSENPPETAESSLNINTASAAELEKLPGIGAEFARRIVEHRERFGKFRRTEHLMLVRGMSDKKFRRIKNLVAAR